MRVPYVIDNKWNLHWDSRYERDDRRKGRRHRKRKGAASSGADDDKGDRSQSETLTLTSSGTGSSGLKGTKGTHLPTSGQLRPRVVQRHLNEVYSTMLGKVRREMVAPAKKGNKIRTKRSGGSRRRVALRTSGRTEHGQLQMLGVAWHVNGRGLRKAEQDREDGLEHIALIQTC